MVRKALMWLLMITILRVRIEKVVEVTEGRISVSGRGGRLLYELGCVRVDLAAHHRHHIRILGQHSVEVGRIQLGILEGVLSARVEELMNVLDVSSERSHVFRRVIVANHATVPGGSRCVFSRR